MSEFRDHTAWDMLEPPSLLPDAVPSPAGLIVGLGNCLLCDDGIGVHAVRRLMRQPPRGALVLEVGTDVFSAVRWMEQVPRVLAIDAMDAGGEPGAIYHCSATEIGAGRCQASLHELGLLAVLEFLPANRRPEITVLGVQPAAIRYGLELSPALAAVLPAVVEAARDLVGAWPLPPVQASSCNATGVLACDSAGAPVCRERTKSTSPPRQTALSK